MTIPVVLVSRSERLTWTHFLADICPGCSSQGFQASERTGDLRAWLWVLAPWFPRTLCTGLQPPCTLQGGQWSQNSCACCACSKAESQQPPPLCHLPHTQHRTVWWEAASSTGSRRRIFFLFSNHLVYSLYELSQIYSFPLGWKVFFLKGVKILKAKLTFFCFLESPDCFSTFITGQQSLAMVTVCLVKETHFICSVLEVTCQINTVRHCVDCSAILSLRWASLHLCPNQRYS